MCREYVAPELTSFLEAAEGSSGRTLLSSECVLGRAELRSRSREQAQARQCTLDGTFVPASEFKRLRGRTGKAISV